MRLYHGSYMTVNTPKILQADRKLDFGTGLYDEDEAIRRLLPQKLHDQYAFKTEESLSALKFIEGVKL